MTLSLGSTACLVFPEYGSPLWSLSIVTGSPVQYTLRSLLKITEEKQQESYILNLNPAKMFLEPALYPLVQNGLENSVTELREKRVGKRETHPA